MTFAWGVWLVICADEDCLESVASASASETLNVVFLGWKGFFLRTPNQR